MKKHLCLFVYISISLALFVGCSNDSNSIITAETESTVTKTTSSQLAYIIDWKPTTCETVNNFEGVTMTVKEGTVSHVGLTVTFDNNSISQCIYGEYFLLEKKINGEWYQVPVTIDGNYAFASIGYELVSKGDREWSVDWEWLYESLDTGEYRIVKDISDFRGTGDYDTYCLAADFTIN